MNRSGRVKIFNDWAAKYDDDLAAQSDSFPFAGYNQVLDELVNLAEVNPFMRILDLGVGTGNLAQRFFAKGCSVWGIDFSPDMILKAREKLPQARLFQADLLRDWPPEIQQPYDRVVSAYVWHEFDLETKINLLQRIVTGYLAMTGRILIADVAFTTRAAYHQAQQYWAHLWDEKEYYWIADEALSACQRAGLQAAFKPVSSCGGVFMITP